MTAFEKAVVVHLIGDWLLQNDWMARHKCRLTHPAAWIHGTIHAALLAMVLGITAGIVLAILHMLVDSRVPQRWWAERFKQTTEGQMGATVMIWGDQVIHVCTIALWLQLAP